MSLKTIFKNYQLKQSELRQAVCQYNGAPLSPAAISLIVNQGLFPKSTPEADIKAQIEDWLKEKGVKEEQIKKVWAADRNSAAHEKNHNPNILNLETEMLAQNAKKHFGLFKSPFDNDVESAQDVYQNAETRYIREAMYQVARHGGFLAVVGESGAGKSTLRRDLIDRCIREQVDITFIQPRTVDKGRLTAAGICDAIVMDCSREKPVHKHEHKARQVERVLTNSLKAGNAHCLIIEEAHDLHTNTLKYLKRIYELEAGFKKLVSIILIGQPELREKLDERINWEAREVIRRCEIAELQPLNNEVESYLKLKFQRVGAALDKIFEPDAFLAIQQKLSYQTRDKKVIGMSYPLVVNNLVIKALNRCVELGLDKVNADLVRGI